MTINTLLTIVPSTALPGGPPGVQGPPGSFVVFGINNQTGVAYITSAGDTGKLLLFSGQTSGVAVSLDPTALPQAGWFSIIKNNNTAGLITITVLHGGLIDGQSTMTIDPKGCTAQIVFDGQNFQTFGPADGGTF